MTDERPPRISRELLKQLMLDDARAWQAYGNCLGVDPALFFPERGASTAPAKAVCAGCVVKTECLDYALTHGEKYGIWGGKSERERRRMRRTLRLVTDSETA